MCWYAESDVCGTAVRSGMSGSVSVRPEVDVFEYIAARSAMNGSVVEGGTRGIENLKCRQFWTFFGFFCG